MTQAATALFQLSFFHHGPSPYSPLHSPFIMFTLREALQHTRNAVFELVFVLTSDNNWIGVLSVIAMTVDYFQLLSFGFSPNLQWGVYPFQKALLYSVLPWPVNSVSYYLVCSLSIIMAIILFALFYQVYFYGGVATIKLLQGGRFLMTICATIFFFPFLETMLSPFRLTHGVHLFPELEDKAIGYERVVVSAIAILLFYLPVLLFTFLYTIPDPMDKEDIAGKITTRPEVIDLLCRSAIVLCATVVDSQLVNSLVYFFVQLLAITVNLTYPYYVRRRFNYLRAGLIGSLLMLACFNLYVGQYPQESPIIAIIALVLLPVAGCFFAFLSHLRFHQLDLRRFMELEDGAEQLVSLCRLPTDVDLATRYCLESEDLAVLQYGIVVYEQGLRKFPKSTYLYSRFALFLVFVVRERLESLTAATGEEENKITIQISKITRLIRHVIRKTFIMKPYVDLHYCFFYIITLMDQKKSAEDAGEDKLDIIDSIRYKHDLRSARFHYRKANEAAFQFWKSVERGSNIWNQVNLADTHRTHSDKAEWYFKRLLLQFTKSTLVLELFTAFLRQIMNDEKGANDLDAQMNKMLERREQIENGEHVSEPDLTDSDDQGHANDTIVYTTLVTSVGRAGERKQNRKRWFAAADRVATWMITTVTVLLVGLIFVYAFSNSLFKGSQIQDISNMGSIRLASQEIAYWSRQLEMAATFGISDTSIPKIQEKLFSKADVLMDTISGARQDSVAKNEAVLSDWNDQDILQFNRDSHGRTFRSLSDIGTIYNVLASDAILVGSMNVTQYQTSPPLSLRSNQSHMFVGQTHWSYVLDNGPREIMLHTWHVVLSTTEATKEMVRASQRIQITLFIIAALVPLLTIFAFVIPSFMALIQERIYVVGLFRKVPEEAVLEMISRHKAIRITTINDDDGRESVISRGTVDQSEVAEEQGIKLPMLLNHLDETPSWIRMMAIFVFSILLLLLVLALSAYFVFSASSFLFQSSDEINYADSRLGLVRRISLLSQELVRADEYVWPEREELREILHGEIEQVRAHVLWLTKRP